jgi:nicotinate-nucleotide adenylyltransferase
MNVALFGGTFDPIHRGHLAIARAARRRFKLDVVYFVPADVPPHKQQWPISVFEHRYAMVTLATASEKTFVPSLLEAPPRYGNVIPYREHESAGGHGAGVNPAANYSIDTVRRLKRQLPHGAKLFFLIGIDAFLEIGTWRQPEALLGEAEFIVASRPGFSLDQVAAALPERLRARATTSPRQASRGSIVLPGATIHLLDQVREKVSATQIRRAVASKRSLGRFVTPAVADYIRKAGLYRGRT